MARASKLEKLMLNLVNGARDRAGLRDLKFDGNLNESAEDHSEWMLRTDIFNHTGAGGSQPTERMREAGYRLTGNWLTGENIALVSIDGDGSLKDEVRQLHQMLMNSPGHRANILKGGYQDIGIGIERGSFKINGQVFDALVVTQNFGRSAAPRQIDAEPLALNAPSRDALFAPPATSQAVSAQSFFTPFWAADDFLF
ncbi:CAP domain-containing protein [Neogemmobacter tilapiae]|uniref:SCP domain-containing protein n=1 Tax=Neogemmobacter tilapiae TaxID=875041 RepID=A0A918TJM9_9RHOB|nr:CAP domain-containing protein [Gemmobacter tilapiae]GHC50058.1 hypothetical protein GCM10007315_10300 [Gemmobacter tilapiae]